MIEQWINDILLLYTSRYNKRSTRVELKNAKKKGF